MNRTEHSEEVYGDWQQPLQIRPLRGKAIGESRGPTYCPGYSRQLPQVVEIARLASWEKRGILDLNIKERDLVITEQALDYLDFFSSEVSDADTWLTQERIKEAKKK